MCSVRLLWYSIQLSLWLLPKLGLLVHCNQLFLCSKRSLSNILIPYYWYQKAQFSAAPALVHPQLDLFWVDWNRSSKLCRMVASKRCRQRGHSWRWPSPQSRVPKCARQLQVLAAIFVIFCILNTNIAGQWQNMEGKTWFPTPSQSVLSRIEVHDNWWAMEKSTCCWLGVAVLELGNVVSYDVLITTMITNNDGELLVLYAQCIVLLVL